MSDQKTTDLLGDLSRWSEDERNFHSDRQLADRVLLATDWRCLPDPQHPAGVKWEFGTNPVHTSWEPHHPHPINSVDSALGQLPFKWRICSMKQSGADRPWEVTAIRDDALVEGSHASLTAAISIAAVRAWQFERKAA
ncbi:MAG: hypothetical protein V4564_07660 [Pseudomonadota bacterium]